MGNRNHDWKDNGDRNYERHCRRNSGRSLWNGFSLLVIGCVLIAVGLSLGGRWSSVSWWPWHRDGNFRFTWDNGNGSFTHSSGGNEITDIEELHGAIPVEITNVEIRLKAASVVIKSGAEGEYRANGFNSGSVSVDFAGDTLKIEETDWQHSINLGDDFPRPSVELILPEGIALSSCRIEMGAGSADIESVKTGELDFSSGAGSIKGRGISASNVVLETGAGSIEFNDCDFGNSRISSGAGRFVFDGSIGDRTQVSTGAGSIEMTVSGSEDDYRIDFERGVGSVRVGNDTFNGVGNGSAGNRAASRKIKVTTGVGSVRIDFEE